MTRTQYNRKKRKKERKRKDNRRRKKEKIRGLSRERAADCPNAKTECNSVAALGCVAAAVAAVVGGVV